MRMKSTKNNVDELPINCKQIHQNWPLEHEPPFIASLSDESYCILLLTLPSNYRKWPNNTQAVWKSNSKFINQEALLWRSRGTRKGMDIRQRIQSRFFASCRAIKVFHFRHMNVNTAMITFDCELQLDTLNFIIDVDNALLSSDTVGCFVDTYSLSHLDNIVLHRDVDIDGG